VLVAAQASRAALVASRGRTWRRDGGRPAWAGPAPPPARHGPAGTGSGRRRSRRCSRSPTPTDRRVGRRAGAAAGSRPGWPARSSAQRAPRWPRPRRRRCGVDPDDELDQLCQHSHALTPCPDVDVDGSVRTDAGQDCDGTHPTSPRVVKLLHQASSAGSGPLPAAAGGQVRRMTPPGSVIPRVTPTATVRDPDHHRTTGQSHSHSTTLHHADRTLSARPHTRPELQG
jgi:hypothetical protein